MGYNKHNIFIILILTLSVISNKPIIAVSQFSQTFSLLMYNNNTANIRNKTNNSFVWEIQKTNPFTELILSWNAIRPKQGKYSFWVSVKNGQWSSWRKIAEWGTNGQKTFSHTRDPFVHVKHVRVEMQKQSHGNACQIKVISENGADIKNVKALFACLSNFKNFIIQRPSKILSSTLIRNIPKQSQWTLGHSRAKDLCSPTATSMAVHYFRTKNRSSYPQTKLQTNAKSFANKVHDDSYLDIYGNWLFNVAQAYNETKAEIFYKVERLNNFEVLHSYLAKKIPIVVSIRGTLNGGAWPYNNGHFVVVVGWNSQKRKVLCIDPAFRQQKKLLRSYHIRDFLRAWGKSRNLSYVPIPKNNKF